MATGVAYNKYKQKIMLGGIDLLNDTIKVALLANTYTPAIDTHEYFSDVSAHELATAGGYTAGGATLAGKTVICDTSIDKGVFDATDPEWTADGTGFTCRYAVAYKDSGDPATSPLIAYWDLGGDQNPVSITFKLIIAATGAMAVA